MPEVVVKTAKKKGGKKPKQAEAQAVETKGLNKLDQIEIDLIDIKEKCVATGSTVGDDHVLEDQVHVARVGCVAVQRRREGEGQKNLRRHQKPQSHPSPRQQQ